jgi:hypothetical protein
MAAKQRFLDVWIVEMNVVYREVPFTVVADWVQQGRLLEGDKLRRSGTKEWFLLGGMAEFAPYLPRLEPTRPQDQAEALEPVQLDFNYKRRHDEEEGDPDMIPLIDVSLVLLIFFMMTTTSIAIGASLQLPAAYYGLKTSNPDLLWVGIDCDAEREPTTYLIGVGDKPADTTYEVQPGDNGPRMHVPPRFLQILDERLARSSVQVEVVIKTNEKLKTGYYQSLLLELQKRPLKVSNKYDGVREKLQP